MFRHETTEVPAPPLPQAATCLNCGHDVPERFCGRCAQDAHHTQRLTLQQLMHHLPHSVWHVDKGVLFTLRSILLRPGPTMLTYLAGQRVNYFHPLSLLLLVTGAYSFAFSLLHIPLTVPDDPAVSEAFRQMQESITAVFFKYLRWIYVAMVPCVAACARLFLRRARFNYAECLYLVAFVTAGGNFIALLYLPISYAYGGAGHLPATNSILLGAVMLYSTWAYTSLLQHTTLTLPARLLRGFLTQVCGLLGSVVVIILLVLGAYAMMDRQAWEAEHQQAGKANEPRSSHPKATK